MNEESEIPDRDTLASEYFERLPFDPIPCRRKHYWDTLPVSRAFLFVPTGTGKTLIAEAAVYEALRTGRQMYYTTPLIALTDQKLDELHSSQQFAGAFRKRTLV